MTSKIKPKRAEKVLIMVSMLVFLFTSAFFLPIKAENEPSNQDLEQQILAKISEKQLQAKTLQQEIQDMEKQIKDVEAKLADIDKQIVQLEQDKVTVLNEITLNETILLREKSKLKDGIRLLYSYGDPNPFFALASDDSVSALFSQEQYLETINDDISNSVDRIKDIKEELDKKKKDLELKQDQVQSLKEQQYLVKQELEGRVMAKNRLLLETKGDEQTYQNLLAGGLQDKEEVMAQLKALSSGASTTAIGLPYSGARAGQRVYRGETIARMGSTGFSTGPHLHFGVYQNGQDRDPLPMISTGFFSVPAPGSQISQLYDGTYSHRGRGPGWPGGIDYANSIGTPIRAAREGIIIFDGVGRGGLDSGFGHYIIIDHQNGYLTLYGHLL